MHVAEFHHVDNPSKRREALEGLDIRTGDYISDAYDHLANQKTKRFLKAIRHGVEIVGMQASATISEAATSISPKDAIPFKVKIWQSIDVENGTVTFNNKPYRILEVRERIYTPEVKQAEIDNVKQEGGGSVLDYHTGDVLSFSYNRNTGKLQVYDGDQDYDGEAWIVEARYSNQTAKNHLVDPYEDIETWRFGPDYPNPHYLHITRLLEKTRQNGTNPDLLYKLVSALAGVPFAYDHGTIQKYYDSHQGFRQAIISNDERTTASFIPPKATYTPPSHNQYEDLKSIGTTVEEFEPLLVESDTESSISFNSGSNQKWETPKQVSDTNAQKNIIILDSTESISADLLNRVKLRMLNSNFKQTYLVRKVEGNSIYVEGKVPSLSTDENAYLQKLTDSATPGNEISVTVPTSYTPTDKEMIKNVLNIITPPGRPLDITITST